MGVTCLKKVVRGLRICEAGLGSIETQRRFDLGQNNGVGTTVAQGCAGARVLVHLGLAHALALGPGREHLLDALGLTADRQQLLLDLLPHTGHTKEDGGAHILHGDGKGALEGIGLAEVRAGTGTHGDVKINNLRSNV